MSIGRRRQVSTAVFATVIALFPAAALATRSGSITATAAIIVDRQSGDAIKPVVVDEYSGERIDLRRVRVELRDGTLLDAEARKRPSDRRGRRRSTRA